MSSPIVVLHRQLENKSKIKVVLVLTSCVVNSFTAFRCVKFVINIKFYTIIQDLISILSLILSS